jgi:hypothetical protein
MALKNEPSNVQLAISSRTGLFPTLSGLKRSIAWQTMSGRQDDLDDAYSNLTETIRKYRQDPDLKRLT